MHTERQPGGLRLLNKENLTKTGGTDHADWNYRLVLGMIERVRFRMATKLLSERAFSSLLEIGYGSGVFMPQLARFAETLYGLDIHSGAAEVRARLRAQGILAQLVRGSAEAMPFRDGLFEAVVAVSTIEFIENLDAACTEIARVLAKRGSLIVVTPGLSPLADLGFRVLTGRKALEEFGDLRNRVMPALRSRFHIVRHLSFPPQPFGNRLTRCFVALDLAVS